MGLRNLSYELLLWGDTPSYGDPLASWPRFGKVGNAYRAWSDTAEEYYPPQIDDNTRLKREDDEILLILTAILKEL
jgi:hypothetical protein